MIEIIAIHLFGGVLGLIGIAIGEWLFPILERKGWQ